MHVVFCFREVEGVDTQPADIVIDMFNYLPCIFYQDVAGIVVALEMLYCISSLSVIVKSVGKLLPQGGCRYWAAFGMPFYGNNAVQLMLCLSILSSTASAMEFEYTEQGKCTWSLYRSMSPLSVHTAIPTVAFFAIEKTVNPVFKFRHLLRPDDGSHTSE